MHFILVVGGGNIGERHRRCFQKTGRALVSGCDPSNALRATIAETDGGPTFANFASALTPTVDAVVICTPPPLHIPITLAALRAGKQVLPRVTTEETVNNQCPARRHFGQLRPQPVSSAQRGHPPVSHRIGFREDLIPPPTLGHLSARRFRLDLAPGRSARKGHPFHRSSRSLSRSDRRPAIPPVLTPRRRADAPSQPLGHRFG